MKAVVLAGGKGTRLAPYTKILPKPLIPIGDVPILEVLLRQMKAAGITEVILTVGHLANLLKAFFQDGEQFGLKIGYSFEEKPLGTSGPLSLIEGLESTFLVTNGDVLTTLDIKSLVGAHQASHAAATIAMYQREVNIDLGVLELDGSNKVVGYNEKPSFIYPVSMGIYVFEPRVLSYIPQNEYLDFPDLILRLIEHGESVMGYSFDGYWQDLGRPDDYERAVLDFDNMRNQFLPDS
ncbi:MAG: NTP transferase domain-containing protein [Chloroflexi bacterium]|nr:NTP transferase domain-containing protein [Chloroflexota bacterium]